MCPGNSGGWRGLCNAVASNARLSDSIGGVWRVSGTVGESFSSIIRNGGLQRAISPYTTPLHPWNARERWPVSRGTFSAITVDGALQLQIGDRGVSHPAYLY